MNSLRPSTLARIVSLVAFLCLVAGVLISLTANRAVHAQSTLGSPLAGLTSGQMSLFNTGFLQFNVKWDPDHGLGVVYTNQDCANCHTSPVAGGTNTTMRTTFFGALNSDGSFNPLTSEGGFILQPHSISTFAPHCTVAPEAVPSDATLTSQRLPPELFGDGLVDAIADSTITNFAGSKGQGVDGMTNTVADWNGVMRPGRFGSKAQFASLAQAVGQAFSHDIGVTNNVNLSEDCSNSSPAPPNASCPNLVTACIKAKEPNDTNGKETLQIMDYPALLAPNPPSTDAAGMILFVSTGCSLCHNPSYTTPANVKLLANFTGGKTSVVNALSNQTVNLYSDLLIHHMGPGLADCMEFGQAQGDQWKTPPLWGLNSRTVYLHDGRAFDLPTAIQDHMSFAGPAACGNTYPDSEANAVIQNFNALLPGDMTTLLNFLGTL
jgi:CxxC motif-containing protein (DUF1111 family)